MHLGVQELWKSLRGTKTVRNSPRNGTELAKTMSVDDRHVNTPQGSSIVEIALGPQNGEYLSMKRAGIGQNCSFGFNNHGNRFGTPKRGVIVHETGQNRPKLRVLMTDT